MKAHYISYFRKPADSGNTEPSFNSEVATSHSKVMTHERHASNTKKRHNISQILVIEETKLFLQYRLDL